MPKPTSKPKYVQQGAALTRLREQQGLTPKEMARRTGLGTETYRKYERGYNSFKPIVVPGLAEALEVPTAQLRQALGVGNGSLGSIREREARLDGGLDSHALRRALAIALPMAAVDVLTAIVGAIVGLPAAERDSLLLSVFDMVTGRLDRLRRETAS